MTVLLNPFRFASTGVTNLDGYLTNLLFAVHQKRLRSAYAGSVMKVRETTGSTLADIGFDADGHLDYAGLTAHVLAGAGRIHTWYDQTATGNNLTQTTNAQQPGIANGATYSGQANFDDVDDCMNSASNLGGLSAFTLFLPGTLFDATPSANDMAWYIPGAPYLYCVWESATSRIVVSDDTRTVKYTATTATFDGWTFRFDSSASGITNQVKAYRNGVVVTAASSSGAGSFGAIGTAPLRLASNGAGSNFSGCGYKGVVLYNAAKSDADIAAIWAIVNAI